MAPNDPPLISVVIPARDARATIARTLRSLQPAADIIGEIIVVDDASCDGTGEIAVDVAQRLGLPVVLQRIAPSGQGKARNVGADMARFAHVFFLDADDLVVAEGLRALHAALAGNPQAGFAFGAYLEHGVDRDEKRRFPSGFTPDRAANRDRYLVDGTVPIAMGSALVHRDLLSKVRFRDRMMIDEDTCFWAEAIGHCDPVGIDQPVLVYERNQARAVLRQTLPPARESYLAFARGYAPLLRLGVSKAIISRRKAWIARGMGRSFVQQGRFAEARDMLRLAVADPFYARDLRTRRYQLRASLAKSSASVPSAAAPGEPVRTLILSQDPAWPPVSGADLRHSQKAQALARLGPVMLASVEPLAGVAEPPEGVEVISLTGGGRLGAPDDAVKLVEHLKPDVLVTTGVHLLDFARVLRPHVPLLVADFPDVESVLRRKLSNARRRSLRRMIGRELRQVEADERATIQLADRVWVCSPEDAVRIYEAHRVARPIDVVPNGIPRADEIPPARDVGPRHGEGPNLLYFGHLNYQPNMQAADRLAHRTFPLIRDLLPNARLTVAGRNPHRHVRALGEMDGVDVIGDPPNAADLLAASDVTLIPLTLGGGTRLKVLEAMAWRVPVIATALAVEGLGLEPGHDYIKADSDADFAQAVAALWGDEARFRTLTDNAHETATRAFGPEALAHAVRRGLGL
ncbi:glycosyltransferase [Tepidamorphus sp. 3E244]|uniref:glycosyltransferase n=1 Tax=Tepidamorphus sp. 3E244 TaxID=3385498 RepID=UPI0038FD3639